MRRHPALRPLSADHHHALVLARRARDSMSTVDLRGLVASTVTQFDREVAPHFALEESTLVQPMRNAGETAVIERLLAEHRGIVEIVDTLRANPSRASLTALGEAIERHVRFEERELFPRIEAVLDAPTLDALASASIARPTNALHPPTQAASPPTE